MHISKALKSRSKAIQHALDAYNQAAQKLYPPRPKLLWSQIVEYTTTAEFELLRMGSREDICNLEWADTRNREATVCHLKLTRAHEEIKRLNIEIKRLGTWIADEEAHLDRAIQASNDPHLTQALQDFTDRQKQVNSHIQRTLKTIYALQGYTGDMGIGQRQHSDVGIPIVQTELIGSDEGGSDNDENELVDEIFDGVARLSLHE